MKIIATQKCPHCHREFIVERIPQTPGCRDKEDLCCPFCEEILETSMEYSFDTYEIEETYKADYPFKKLLRII